MTTQTEADTNVETEAQAEKIIKIELTVNEINVVFAALQELPHRIVDPILKNLIQQAQAQLQA